MKDIDVATKDKRMTIVQTSPHKTFLRKYLCNPIPNPKEVADVVIEASSFMNPGGWIAQTFGTPGNDQ